MWGINTCIYGRCTRQSRIILGIHVGDEAFIGPNKMVIKEYDVEAYKKSAYCPRYASGYGPFRGKTRLQLAVHLWWRGIGDRMMTYSRLCLTYAQVEVGFKKSGKVLQDNRGIGLPLRVDFTRLLDHYSWECIGHCMPSRFAQWIKIHYSFTTFIHFARGGGWVVTSLL